MQTAAFLLFGPSGAGKSSVGIALAEAMERCAHIEVDGLRYMVRGGLVAWSRGKTPMDDAAEYTRQCELGYKNAVALCREFSSAGFSAVVEGLGDQCRPGTGWIEREFAGLGAQSILLLCTPNELERRLDGRPNWPSELTKAALQQLSWYESNRSTFDVAIDTTELGAGQVARALLQRIRKLAWQATQ